MTDRAHPAGTPPAPHRYRPALVAAVLVALMVATAWPVVFAQVQRGRMALDQLHYHERTVRAFINAWPAPDLTNYWSATTPGYHLVIAGAANIVGDTRTTLQLIASLFTVALLGLLGWALGSRAPPPTAVALGLPVVFSLYVWPAGVWLLPDNAGWLLVLGVVLLALRTKFGLGHLLAAGVVLAALVLVRQIHLWAAAALWMGAWLGAGHDPDSTNNPGPLDGSFAGELRWLLTPSRDRVVRTGLMVLATLPAFLIVAHFARTWGGLTPPLFQGEFQSEAVHTGGNPAAPAFILALIGFISLFFAGYLAAPFLHMWRTRPWVILVAAGVGALLALLPETTYDRNAGRWTGLWIVADNLPVIAGRSLLILVGSTLGAVACAAWCSGMGLRDRWMYIAVWAAFVAAQTASFQIWQRYSEPMVLLMVAVACTRLVDRGPQPRLAPAARIAGPVLLAAMFALVTVYHISTSTPADFSAVPTEP